MALLAAASDHVADLISPLHLAWPCLTLQATASTWDATSCCLESSMTYPDYVPTSSAPFECRNPKGYYRAAQVQTRAAVHSSSSLSS
eukprot:6046282-Pleurochrysis_carterae.AAC.2